MNKLFFAILLAGALALLLAQQPLTGPGRVLSGGATQAPVYAPWELLSVYPRESAPGEFLQVDPAQLQQLSDQGWQLVSVSPYIYRNEEHSNGTPSPPLITQVYHAYFFQRARLIH